MPRPSYFPRLASIHMPLHHWGIIALMAVTVSAGCDSLEGDPSDVPSDEIARLTVEGSSRLRANGTDQAEILLRIPADSDVRLTIMSTTGGSFLFSSSRTIEVPIDSVAEPCR